MYKYLRFYCAYIRSGLREACSRAPAGHETTLTVLHNHTPQNTYYTVLVTTPTAWHSSTYCHPSTSTLTRSDSLPHYLLPSPSYPPSICLPLSNFLSHFRLKRTKYKHSCPIQHIFNTTIINRHLIYQKVKYVW